MSNQDPEVEEIYDWKSHDTQDHGANAAYYDQLAQEQSRTAPVPMPEALLDALTLVRNAAYEEPTVCDSSLRQAAIYAAIAQAEATERIAMQLGNIHQALLTPDANREPTTAADQLKRQAVAMESLNEFIGDLFGATDLTAALQKWSARVVNG